MIKKILSNKKKAILVFITAIISCLALAIYGNTNIVTPDGFYSFTKLWNSFHEPAAIRQWIGGFFALLLFLYFFSKYGRLHGIAWYEHVLAVFFSLMCIAGKSFLLFGDTRLITMNLRNILLAAGALCGYYILFVQILHFIVEKTSFKEVPIKKGILYTLFEKYPWQLCSLFILVCWLPYIICFAPGILHVDAMTQLHSFFRTTDWTTHFPPFSTLLMGYTMKIGEHFGSINLGCALYVFPQVILMIISFSYCFVLFRKWKTPVLFRIITLSFFAFYPLFPTYALKEIKDTSYYIVCMWVCFFLCNHIELDFFKAKNYAAGCLTACLYCLLRNEAKYILLFIMGCLACTYIVNRKKNCLRIIGIFFAGIVLSILITNIICNVYRIVPGSKKEMLSQPVQQTARYMKNYKGEITEEEWAVITSVFGNPNLDEIYEPDRSDNVKDQMKYDISWKELVPYFKVWAQQGIKHPACYLSASFHSTYGYFYPGKPEYYGIRVTLSSPPPEMMGPHFEGNQITFTVPADKGRAVLETWYKTVLDLPLIKLLYRPAAYVWVLLISLLFVIKYKRYQAFLISSFPIGVLIICFLSPVNGAIRYTLPIVVTLPIVLGYIGFSIRNGNAKTATS